MMRNLRVRACVVAISLAASATAWAEHPWRPVAGAAADRLVVKNDSLELTDTTGETYEKESTFKAIFTRKPQYKAPYVVEATVSNIEAVDKYAQAGLIIWRDADNYVRLTGGFKPDAVECLAEFGGKARSRGTFPLYPATFDNPLKLKMEVLEHCVRGYASFDGRHWLMLGGFTTPELQSTEEFFTGIGITGNGGKMKTQPLFTDWKETPLPPVKCGELLKPELPWILAQGNSGWGRESVKCDWTTRGLELSSFSGSDIFFRVETYPFVGLSAPDLDSYRLETKIRSFDPRAEGAFNKAGIVVWSASGRMLNIGVVADKQFNQMYLELLVDGEKTASRQFAWHDMSASDIYLRVDVQGDRYTLSGSYDAKEWMSVEPLTVSLPEPQLRLMVSGDVFLQSPEQPPNATFEYLRCEGTK